MQLLQSNPYPTSLNTSPNSNADFLEPKPFNLSKSPKQETDIKLRRKGIEFLKQQKEFFESQLAMTSKMLEELMESDSQDSMSLDTSSESDSPSSDLDYGSDNDSRSSSPKRTRSSSTSAVTISSDYDASDSSSSELSKSDECEKIVASFKLSAYEANASETVPAGIRHHFVHQDNKILKEIGVNEAKNNFELQKEVAKKKEQYLQEIVNNVKSLTIPVKSQPVINHAGKIKEEKAAFDYLEKHELKRREDLAKHFEQHPLADEGLINFFTDVGKVEMICNVIEHRNPSL